MSGQLHDSKWPSSEFVHRSEWKEQSSLTAACLAMEALDLQEEQVCWGPSNPARRGLITFALHHPAQHWYSQPSPPLLHERKRTLYLSALTAHTHLLPHSIYSFSVLILYFVRRVSDTPCSGTSVLGCFLQMLPKYYPLFSRVADLVMRAPFALHCLLKVLLACSVSICPLTML